MSLFSPPSGGGGFLSAVNPFSDDFGSFAKANPLSDLNPFNSGGLGMAPFLGGSGGMPFGNPLESLSKFNPLDPINPVKQFNAVKDFATSIPNTLSGFNPLKPWETADKLAPPGVPGVPSALDPLGITKPPNPLNPSPIPGLPVPGLPGLPGLPSPIGTGPGGVPLLSSGSPLTDVGNVVQALQGGGAPVVTPPPVPVMPPPTPVMPAPAPVPAPAPAPAPINQEGPSRGGLREMLERSVRGSPQAGLLNPSIMEALFSRMGR